MCVQQADGKREHRQTRVLLLKIGEGHELFKEVLTTPVEKRKNENNLYSLNTPKHSNQK